MAKWLPEEALQIAEKEEKRKAKAKEKDTENKLVVARGKGARGMNEIGEVY